MEIVLGTAQFGLNYGITNSSGIVQPDEVKSILNYAADEGIKKLDTAQAYGDSEIVIGDYPCFDIMTKLSAKKIAPAGEKNVNIKKSLDKSLNRLNRSSVYSVMIHDVEEINFEITKRCLDMLERLKEDGAIRKVGVSLYSPEKFLEITSNFLVDIVQVPINVFDQRFCSKKIKSVISEQKIDLYARSIFLQGSLLVPETPKNLMKWDGSFKSYRKFCMETKLSQMGCCLNFIKSLDFIKGIVVGITKKSELKEIIDEFRLSIPKIDFSHLVSTESKLINPSLW